jgi:glycosyltransferase involved in cell wall biosynthesis
MTFAIIIATYGLPLWEKLAVKRALPTAATQDPDELIVYHDPDGDAASARNGAAEHATADYLVFLDADDELAPGYLQAMRRAIDGQKGERLLLPAASYVSSGRTQTPMFWPEIPIEDGNPLVIGTGLSRQLFLEVGGFDSRPEFGCYEDYHFWGKCTLAGAKIMRVEDAVYRVHIDPCSRRRAASDQEKLAWHYAVGRDLWPDRYPEGWLARNSPR